MACTREIVKIMKKTTACTIRKIRGKGFVSVDPQITLWRKHRKKRMPSLETPRQRALKASRLKKEALIKAGAYDIFGNDS